MIIYFMYLLYIFIFILFNSFVCFFFLFFYFYLFIYFFFFFTFVFIDTFSYFIISKFQSIHYSNLHFIISNSYYKNSFVSSTVSVVSSPSETIIHERH